MRLEDVTARLRPRSGWESQDLGLAIVRGIAGRLLVQWLCVMIPIWALMAWALRDHPGRFLFAVWWLKPLYDRIPLFTLGRKLFGQETSLKQLLKAAPGLLFRRNLYFLTFGRFSFYRCFSMPVRILEGGKFGAYRRRASVLLHMSGSTVVWVTIAWTIVSLLGTVGCFLLAKSWSIEEGDASWTEFWIRVFGRGSMQPENSTLWLVSGLYLFVMSLTEMFYLGSGFGMYLNSRSHMEGWDIEISFRSLAGRIANAGAGAVTTLLAVLAFSLAGTTPCEAKIPSPAPSTSVTVPSAPDPDAIIKTIKANPDFKVHEETIDVPVPGPYTGPTPDFSGNWWESISSLMSVAWYFLLAVAAAALCWLIYKFRHVFRWDSSSKNAVKSEGPKTVLGLDVAPEALPRDIPAAAWQRWQAGDTRGALRLLYAGSISWMISKGGLPIRESDTEGDCVRHSSLLPNPQQTTYFSNLTSSWIGNAYGSISPEEMEMSTLVKGWPFP